MKTYKQFITEAKQDTDWTKTMSDKDMQTHLTNIKAKSLFNNIVKHKAFQDYHSVIPTGNKTGYQHRISDGHHEVRLASTGKPGEQLHVIGGSKGNIYTVNHIKKSKDSEGNTIQSLIKRYEKD